MERLQVLWVGKAYILSGSGIKSHSHPYYHMFHFISQQCQMTLDGTAYSVSSGQTILVPPNMEHSLLNDKKGTCEYLEIKFSLPSASGHLRKNEPTLSDSSLVGDLCQQIIEEYTKLGNLADDAAGSYMSSLLNVLTAPDRYSEKRRFRFFDGSAYSELSQKIIRYLEKHYFEDISLDDLAASMDYNKSYLCVAFKKDTRITILDCLNTIRIRRAAELIVYSDHTLTQVAELCGFASVSHFNRVFLKYVGATPGQCRRAFPVDVLLGDHPPAAKDGPSRFIYSVLAHKHITPTQEMDQRLRDFESKHGPDQ